MNVQSQALCGQQSAIVPQYTYQVEEVGNRVLLAIEECRFEDVLNLLKPLLNGGLNYLTGPAEFCLIKASANPNTPKEVIERLLDKGLNPYLPENPKDFGLLGAMLPISVAAKAGNLTALNVFLEKDMYNNFQRLFAAQSAHIAFQDELRDLLLLQPGCFDGGRDHFINSYPR